MKKELKIGDWIEQVVGHTNNSKVIPISNLVINTKTKQLGLIVYEIPNYENGFDFYKINNCGAWMSDECIRLNINQAKKVLRNDDLCWGSLTSEDIKEIISI